MKRVLNDENVTGLRIARFEMFNFLVHGVVLV